MGNPNPKLLPALDSVRETQTFTDAQRPGLAWTFTFEVHCEYGFETAYLHVADEFAETYVTGKDGGPPAMTIPIGGRQPYIDESLCKCIAYLMHTNATEPDIEEVVGDGKQMRRWGFDEWFAFSVNAPRAFSDALLFAQELLGKAREIVKN